MSMPVGGVVSLGGGESLERKGIDAVWRTGGGGLATSGVVLDNGVMSVLPDHAIVAALQELPGWVREGESIVRSFECASFADAIRFVSQAGALAENADHHPDIDIRWRTVKIVLSTHSDGGITEKDLAMARALNGVAGGW